MIRLRRGKWRAGGTVPGGISATTSAGSGDALAAARLLRRIDDVDPAGDHREAALPGPATRAP